MTKHSINVDDEWKIQEKNSKQQNDARKEKKKAAYRVEVLAGKCHRKDIIMNAAFLLVVDL